MATPNYAATAASQPPLPPRFAFVRTPAWDQAEPVTREALAELVEALGDSAAEVDLGPSLAPAIDLHRIIMEAEMAHNLHRDYEQGGDQLSAVLRKLIERGRQHKAVEHQRAVAAIPTINQAIDAVFDEYDAIITPAAPGPAPGGLQATGNPVFCTTWTYLGLPAVTLPLLASEGLPMGVQLVGRRDNDARLLRTAAWLVNNLGRKGRARRAGAKAAAKAGNRKGKSR